jgi:uncharacterized RDD family membrane protein YckC
MDVGGLPKTGRVVRYRRSWGAASVRIVLELLAVSVVAIAVGGALSANPAIAPLMSVVVGVSLVALAVPVILQPSVNRSAHREIRDALNAVGASPHTKPLYDVRGARARHSCVVLAPENSEHTGPLCRIAERAGLRPMPMQRPTHAAALRESVRQLRDCALVLADLSQVDADVEYLLGVAHGLGRKTLLASAEEQTAQRGTPVHRFAATYAEAAELTTAVETALRDPLYQGPVAAVLADDWVFGDNLAGRRVLAFVIDAAISVGLAWAYLVWRAVPDDAIAAGLTLSFGSVLALMGYRFLSLALVGTTPGMAAVGLRVIDVDGRRLLRPSQALGRSFATYVAMLPFFGAALMALFGPRYQTLEDALSGTRVVKR